MRERPKAVIFDLDNTLAEAFRPPKHTILTRLEKLLPLVPTAIMSAASLGRIKNDVLLNMSPSFNPADLTLFTANAAQCFIWKDGAWRAQYEFGFTDEERDVIQSALESAVFETDVLKGTKKYGDQFVDYEGYIAYTAMGLNAPSDERKAWDPTGEKRMRLRKNLIEKLPQFDVFIGGATSVDVTPRGINKSYGVTWFSQHLNVKPEEMLYVGDALYEGGNDIVVVPTGVQTRSVANPQETEPLIDELLTRFSN